MELVLKSRRQTYRNLPIFVDPDQLHVHHMQVVRNVQDEKPASMRGRFQHWRGYPNPPDVATDGAPRQFVIGRQPPFPVRELEGRVRFQPLPNTGLDSQPIIPPIKRIGRYPPVEVLKGRVRFTPVIPPPLFVPAHDVVRRVDAPRPPWSVLCGRVWLRHAYPSGLNAPPVPDTTPLRADESDTRALRPEGAADTLTFRANESDTVVRRA